MHLSLKYKYSRHWHKSHVSSFHRSPAMSPMPRSYRLPDLHRHCPWAASFSPHYHVTATASSKWVLSYVNSTILPREKLKFFEQGGSELLCAYAYPYAGPEQLRTCCDFVNLLFTIDEISDRQDCKGAKATAATVLNTMRDDAYDDGTVLCMMTKEYVYPLSISN